MRATLDSRVPRSNADSYQRIYEAVKRIPRGRVATYGQIATLAGLDGHARQVGYALHSLPDGSDIPWHRVINAKGERCQRQRTRGDSHELQLDAACEAKKARGVLASMDA